ncbi:Cytochrome P450 [Tolypocladium paradoxum]|uniref:Cytochrome P450 n=1 Tax=Tolypocladium paradoxum TaxID=94208 RepID=A0A2S4L0Q7_9HYPO|nr:Cytochrome P450 [Tolypocladium paradoxum]
MANLVHWAALVALGAAASYLRDAASVVAFLGCSIALLTGLRLLWSGFLWPTYFSPLRHLPTVPDGGRVFSRETLRLYTQPRGVPQSDWVNKLGHVPQGLVRYRSILGTERLLVLSPEALAEVLVHKTDDFPKPPFIVNELRQVVGMGLLLAEGDDHRFQRKMLQPAFAFRHVKDLYPVFWTVAERLVTTMAEQDSATPHPSARDRTITIDIADWAGRAALDMIGIAGMGQDFGAIRETDSELHRAYRRVFQNPTVANFLAVLRLLLPNWFVNWLPLGRNRELRRSVQTLRSFCRQMIHEARSQQSIDEAGSSVYSSGKNILTVALSAGAFADESLVDQLVTFLTAGHETTGTALTWAVYLLCVHPEMQEKLRSEVRSSLPSPSPSTKTPESLAAVIDTGMPYLNAVCKEVLRYFPPVPITYRQAIRDTSVLQTPVPAGTIVVLAPRVTNRDSSLWGSDAQVFNPDRWLSSGDHRAMNSGSGTMPEDRSRSRTMEDGGDIRASKQGRAECRAAHKGTSPRSNFASMTFLHGPRSCIGQQFATAELAIVLAVLVGRFEFRLADESLLSEQNLKVSRGATARPTTGILVKAKVVDGW